MARDPLTGQLVENGAALVTTGEILPSITRVARFDAVADMPVWSATPATWQANVLGKLCTFDSLPSTARRIQACFHGVESGVTGVALAGAVAMGAAFTINADDDAAAAAILAFGDIAGNETSSVDYDDLFIVSAQCPIIDLKLDAAISNIYAIGLANTLAVPTNVIPCLLEFRVIG